MGEENPIVYLLGGGGLAIILVAFVKGAWDYLRGRHDREIAQSKDRRDTIAALKDDVREAEREADEARTERLNEQRKAGAYWEAYAQFRQHVIREHHIDPDSLPPWPASE